MRVYGVLLYNVSQHLADDCNCLIFKQLLEVPYSEKIRLRVSGLALEASLHDAQSI